MRVISGIYKGRTLTAPKGSVARPTTDRVKESLFGIIHFRMPGASVLDLFAGSGALGIEALSRGAKEAVFADASFFSIQAVKANLSACRAPGEVIHAPMLRAAQRLSGRKFDVIFLDPPYALNLLSEALDAIVQYDLLERDGLIVAEHAAERAVDIPEQLIARDMRKYGDTAITLISWRAEHE